MEVRLIENKELLESVELFKIENLVMGNREDCKNLWVYWIRSGGRIVYQTCVCGEGSSPGL